jgi:hypothetical protein
MKKPLVLVAAAALAATLHAAEQAEQETRSRDDGAQSTVWPSIFAICEWPDSPDVVGLRVTVPFSTRQEGVTGFDVGLWGRCRDFEGLQASLLRNDVKDSFGGAQAGFYNTINRGDLCCVQFGVINEAQSFRGVQAGVINVTGDGYGFQLGLINRSETLYGLQVGLVNVIRDAEVPVLPVVNVGF